MRTEKQAHVKNGIARMVVTLLAVLIRVVWIVVLFVGLNQYSANADSENPESGAY